MDLKKSLILDRGVLTELVFALKDSKNRESTPLFNFLCEENSYEKIYYESIGESGIEAILFSNKNISNKLLATPEKKYSEKDEEKLLLKTINLLQQQDNILEAIQKYHIKKGGPPRTNEQILGYAVKLLLMSRYLDADILPWYPREELFHEMFNSCGYSPKMQLSLNDSFLLKTYECYFPFYPRKAINKEVREYGLLFRKDSFSSSVTYENEDKNKEPRNSTKVFTKIQKNHFKWQISYNKIDAVIKELIASSENLDQKNLKDIIELSSRWSNHQNEIRNQLIEKQLEYIERNKIVNSLIDIIDDI